MADPERKKRGNFLSHNEKNRQFLPNFKAYEQKTKEERLTISEIFKILDLYDPPLALKYKISRKIRKKC